MPGEREEAAAYAAAAKVKRTVRRKAHLVVYSAVAAAILARINVVLFMSSAEEYGDHVGRWAQFGPLSIGPAVYWNGVHVHHAQWVTPILLAAVAWVAAKPSKWALIALGACIGLVLDELVYLAVGARGNYWAVAGVVGSILAIAVFDAAMLRKEDRVFDKSSLVPRQAAAKVKRAFK